MANALIITLFIMIPISFIFILGTIYPISQKELRRRILELCQINKNEYEVIKKQKELIVEYQKLTKKYHNMIHKLIEHKRS